MSQSEQYEISGGADTARFVADLKEAANLQTYEALRQTATAEALRLFQAALPPIPAVQELAEFKGVYTSGRSDEAPLELVDQQADLVAAARYWSATYQVAWRAGGQNPSANEIMTPEKGAKVTSKLAGVLRGGNIEVIGKRMQQVQSLFPRTALDKLLPFVLVHSAALATLWQEAQQSGIGPHDELPVTEVVDNNFQQICASIVAGEEIVIDNSNPVSTTVTGAFKALQTAYNMFDDPDFITEAAVVLMPLYHDMKISNVSEIDTRKLAKLDVDMQRYGVRVAAAARQLAGITASKRFTSMADMMDRRHAEYIKTVERMQAKFGQGYFARSLVHAIADGKIKYFEASVLAELLTYGPLVTRELNIKAEKQLKARRQEALARQRVEEREARRLQVEEQLRAIGLSWRVFPTEPGAGIPRQTRGRGAGESAEPKLRADIDPSRLAALMQIKDAFDGELYISEFNKGVVSGESSEMSDDKRWEVYYVVEFDAVLADGSHITIAIGESAKLGSKLHIWRSDVPGLDDWRLEFSRSRTHAQLSGVLAITHPPRLAEEHAASTQADRFGMDALEVAFLPLPEFRARWQRAVKSLAGRRAVEAVVDKPTEQS